MQNLYKEVTDRIVRELESGTAPWVKPWRNAKTSSFMPANLFTGRPYSGLNVLLLWCEASEKGYPTHSWATFQQAKEVGANVRKGEKSSLVVFVKPMKDEDEEKAWIVMRSFRVFNLAQLDNVPEKYVGEPQEPPPVDAHPLLNVVPVIHGGNRACYFHSRDQIAMPHREQFVSEEEYYATLAHELIHASGHESRLNRQFGKRFGDRVYGMEELTAELGSAFLCARLGIPHLSNSAAYLQSWITTLKEDIRAIFSVASAAQKGADWVWNAAYPERMAAE